MDDEDIKTPTVEELSFPGNMDDQQKTVKIYKDIYVISISLYNSIYIFVLHDCMTLLLIKYCI